MSGFSRTKRVTDPLDDKAKARLVGGGCGQLSYVSSGSEHSAVESPCLSELVHDFLEDEDGESPGYESDSDRVDSVADRTESVEDIMRSAGVSDGDPYRNLVLARVLKAMEVFSCVKSQRSILRRKVMSFLRETGHNAAICKTKWDSSGGLTSGSYEFIDVVVQTASQNRYVVDLDFASQFEIARPTNQYLSLSQSLPRVFVGKIEVLKRIVKAMSDAAKRSLKSRELCLPPWRKNRYMQNKWLGPYRRTVNPAPANSLAPSISAAKCRRVGFDVGPNGVGLFVRTR